MIQIAVAKAIPATRSIDIAGRWDVLPRTVDRFAPCFKSDLTSAANHSKRQTAEPCNGVSPVCLFRAAGMFAFFRSLTAAVIQRILRRILCFLSRLLTWTGGYRSLPNSINILAKLSSRQRRQLMRQERGPFAIGPNFGISRHYPAANSGATPSLSVGCFNAKKAGVGARFRATNEGLNWDPGDRSCSRNLSTASRQPWWQLAEKWKGRPRAGGLWCSRTHTTKTRCRSIDRARGPDLFHCAFDVISCNICTSRDKCPAWDVR
ncbi:unnamed protein product [Trichogramma brassicae]|uniref:Uncharacterized protein n=1 Tax=Trichogramma brassicae TaxID=86971 RepID=A0A6H5IVE7_9HYME|nr:unnamed protein product [Trichogramma brassicae]